MSKKTSAHTKKYEKVMGEYKEGKLRSGSKQGKKVTKKKQAQAIASSEAARDVRGKRPKWLSKEPKRKGDK